MSINARTLIGWRGGKRTLLVEEDVEVVLGGVGLELVVGDNFGHWEDDGEDEEGDYVCGGLKIK